MAHFSFRWVSQALLQGERLILDLEGWGDLNYATFYVGAMGKIEQVPHSGEQHGEVRK